ncbi:MAG: hypothetical protein MW690_000299 [Methanophagales archaeon]|nr:hypothetical protein [Methanophagales archaeon]
MKLRKGQVACKKCGLTLDRQLCGAINIYLRMCGFPQRPGIILPLGCETYDEVDEKADEIRHEGAGRGCHERGQER